VSKVVDVPQVSMRAVPDTPGVHWKTCSGAEAAGATQPLRALAPAVVPANVPPSGGIAVQAGQAPGRVVVVVVVPGGGIVTGTLTTLFASLSSAMRLKGSSVTRSV
jgi:acetyl esterase/lipase